jgi:DNA-binding PadR family transcriptional regulator
MSISTPPATGIDHALLGLLRQRPMHAYEMARQLLRAEELGLVWHLKQSHLYALLARLEAAGYLASATATQGNRPPRKMLHLTARGEAAFAEWLASPVEHGRDFRLEFLAKLFFAARDGSPAIAALLAGQRLACARWLDDLEAQLRAVSASQPFEQLVLRFRLGQIQAILPWLDQCAQVLSAPASQRGDHDVNN